MVNLQREIRVDKILSSLKNLDYLSTSQLQRLHKLGGDRNTRRVMQSMSDYVSHWFDGENVYYLNKAGRERIGSQNIRTKISPVTHYLMRNDFFIHNNPEVFETEPVIEVGSVTVRPDAWVRIKGGYYFLEVDNTQRMVKNQQKVEKYKKLKATGAFQKQYGYFPRVLWVTTIESRKRLISTTCGDLSNKVILWDEIK